MKKELEAKTEPVTEDEAERLELLLDEIQGPVLEPVVPEKIEGIVVGSIAGLEGDVILVRLVPSSAPVRARSMVAISSDHVGRQAALMFERGDPSRPMVMGLVETLGARPIEGRAAPAEVPADAPEEAPREEETEERIVLSAQKDIVLQCGKASITLTRAGKILIKGAYVLTRSTGVNRILGGTVQIN